VPLDASQARHAREVLRLPDGYPVEVFDDQGIVGTGVLVFEGPRDALVRVEQTSAQKPAAIWSVASAVPKGERADWMVEKLSELGAAAFIPLIAARSVVLPEGRNKRERWIRIATESAKQSRRPGVMRIDELSPLEEVLKKIHQRFQGICLSTGPIAVPIVSALEHRSPGGELILLVGPEGGWTEDELLECDRAGAVQVRLTSTILRVETAAIAAAAIVAAVPGHPAP
jgi:16S rRNA (uracil1498-N3)-methyltransferase